jgi:hypothetical protein
MGQDPGCVKLELGEVARSGSIRARSGVETRESPADHKHLEGGCRMPEFPQAMSDPHFALASAYRALFTIAGGYATARLAPDPCAMLRLWRGSVLSWGWRVLLRTTSSAERNSARPGTRSRSPWRPSPASGFGLRRAVYRDEDARN